MVIFTAPLLSSYRADDLSRVSHYGRNFLKLCPKIKKPFLSARERKPRASSDRFSLSLSWYLSQILLLCQDFDPHTHTHTTKITPRSKIVSIHNICHFCLIFFIFKKNIFKFILFSKKKSQNFFKKSQKFHKIPISHL